VAAVNIISVDVEDYFQVEAFANVVPRDCWDQYPSRIEQNTARILDLFAELNITATFFILGWAADRFPRLVRRIVSEGHEPACHSYWHRLVYGLTPAQFRADALLAKNAIEHAAGEPIYGYRAPSFSVTPRSAWALDILRELGFQYDSSVYPVRHDMYGFPNAPRIPFRLETASGALLEFPLATFRIGPGPVMPLGGGGYLRMLPRWYNKAGLRRAWREGLTVVSYIHPWEFDPEQPRIQAGFKSRLRHYTNLGRTEARLRELLALGRFTSFRDSGLADFRRQTVLQTVGA
jgi:polysaccharide deacetylase family protein (PEP-CTERM system associated)